MPLGIIGETAWPKVVKAVPTVLATLLITDVAAVTRGVKAVNTELTLELIDRPKDEPRAADAALEMTDQSEPPEVVGEGATLMLEAVDCTALQTVLVTELKTFTTAFTPALCAAKGKVSTNQLARNAVSLSL